MHVGEADSGVRGFDENVIVAQALDDTLLRKGLGGGVEAECGQFVFGGIHGCAGRESQRSDLETRAATDALTDILE